MAPDAAASGCVLISRLSSFQLKKLGLALIVISALGEMTYFNNFSLAGIGRCFTGYLVFPMRLLPITVQAFSNGSLSVSGIVYVTACALFWIGVVMLVIAIWRRRATSAQ